MEAQRSISVKDLYWAAGFLEGEGSFMFEKNGSPNSRILRCCAGQVQREPLDRLQTLLGGTVVQYRAYGKSQPACRWQTNGRRAAGIMMSLYSLMSPRRQEQIKTALGGWKARSARPSRATVNH